MSKSFRRFRPLSKLVKMAPVWSKQKQMFCRTNLHRLLSIGSLSFLLTLSSPFIPYSPCHISSLQVLAQSNDLRKAEADSFMQQGFEQFQTSKFEAALQSWQQALDIYQKIKDRQGEGGALGNLGLVYHVLGDYPKTIEYQERYLKIAQDIKDHKGERIGLGNLGLAYYSMGDYPKAIEFYERSLKMAQDLEDREKVTSVLGVLGNLGLAYLSMGDYPKTIEYQELNLKIAQDIKDRKEEGIGLGNLGLTYYSMGDYPKAIEFHERSLKIAQDIKDRLGEGNALNLCRLQRLQRLQIKPLTLLSFSTTYRVVT